MAKQKFSYDSIQDVQSVQKYFKSIIKSLEEGRISVSSGEEAIVLEPGALLHFSVEARKKGRKNKISFELRWTDKKEQLQEQEDRSPIKISHKSDNR